MAKVMEKTAIKSSAKSQQGLSIIELMIAITLGLLLLTGITQIFLSNKTTFNMTDSLSRLEENGRFAMEVLAKNIRMGGYADPSKAEVPPPFYGQCGATDSNCISKKLGCTASEANCTSNGAGTASDRLAVYYDPVDDRDCVDTAHEGLLVNVFWVQNDPSNDNLPSLYCRGYDPKATPPDWIAGSSGQPVAPGVENFQVLYGVYTGAGTDLTPDKYVNASEVDDWTNVKTARIGLLMRAGGAGGASTEERKFSVLDVAGDDLTFTDNQPRMLYTTTVSINNVNLSND